MTFLVCDSCRSGVRKDFLATFKDIGRIVGESGCACGGTYRELPADLVMGCTTSLAEVLTHLYIADLALQSGDCGSARSALQRAISDVRKLVSEESPNGER